MIRAEKSDLQIGYYGAFERGNHAGNATPYRDGYTVAAFHTPEQDSLTTLAVVTHAIGEREAYFGSEILLQTMNEVFDQTSTIENVRRLLEHGFQLADPLIVQIGEIAVSSSSVVIVGRRLYVASIGDCRIFLIRAGKSKQLSIEHTFAERLIALGDTTLEELMESTYDGRCPYRILGAGIEDKITIDLRLRLDASETDEQAIANQGLLLRPNDIVVVMGNIFRDFMIPADWEFLNSSFSDITADAQTLVDRFVTGLRQRNYFGSITVVALKVLS